MPEAKRRRAPTRPTRLTGRAAVLAVVLCAIALSLAYPLREYIAQRNQIDQLLATQRSLTSQVASLRRQQRQLNDPADIEKLAEQQLHMCMPNATCYVVLGDGGASGGTRPSSTTSIPWYGKVWWSVRQADTAGRHAGRGTAR